MQICSTLCGTVAASSSIMWGAVLKEKLIEADGQSWKLAGK